MELRRVRSDAYTVSEEFDEQRIAAYAAHLRETANLRRGYRHDCAKSLHDVFQHRMSSNSELEDAWYPWGIVDISVDTHTEIRLAREPGIHDWIGMSVQMRYVTEDQQTSDPFILFALRRDHDGTYWVVHHEMVMDGEFTFVDIATITSLDFAGLDLVTIRDFYEHHADNVQPSLIEP